MADLTSNQVCNICSIHYNAGLRCCALGSLVEGGYLFAKRGGIAWIVACSSRNVSRSWANRNDAVTVAQASNACGDWFVPSRTDLQLGHDCKSFWDSFSSTYYWTSTESNATTSWSVVFSGGTAGFGNIYASNKTYTSFSVRAFRRVSY
jgi:hypothetical protein